MGRIVSLAKHALITFVWCGGILALSGCQLLAPADEIKWIEKGNSKKKSAYLISRECELLEEVIGSYGDDDAFLTIIATNDYLREGAREDLEDNAKELGANTIQITDNREYQKQLRTRLGLFKVEIYANAYFCKK
jgi:hypothetical protein